VETATEASLCCQETKQLKTVRNSEPRWPPTNA